MTAKRINRARGGYYKAGGGGGGGVDFSTPPFLQFSCNTDGFPSQLFIVITCVLIHSISKNAQYRSDWKVAQNGITPELNI